MISHAHHRPPKPIKNAESCRILLDPGPKLDSWTLSFYLIDVRQLNHRKNTDLFFGTVVLAL